MPQVTIHAHGTCPDNQGPGGFAAIVSIDAQQITLHGGDPCTTPQRMHLTALVYALRMLAHHQVPAGTVVSLASGPNQLTNLLQNQSPKAHAPNEDLYRQILQAARPYALSSLPEALNPTPDLAAHCTALATQQLELTISYQIPWCTASMALHPLTQSTTPPTPTPPETASPQRDEQEAQATLDELLELLVPADKPEDIRNGPPGIAASETQPPTRRRP